MTLSPRRWRALAAAVVVATAGLGSLGLAQNKLSSFNERDIEPQLHALDKPENWTLNFRFKDPRVITADVPGRGKRIVWYLWYQVINNTGEPRFFVPDFELKTHDYETVHPDEVLPAVQAEIAKIEDPTGRLDIKNSVTISKQPIPVSKKDAFPRAVTGVAIWTDVYTRAPKTNRFSIFIAGLSDAWNKDKNGVIRRKTLQLNFQRLGDEIQNDPNAIRWVDNPSWIYRATDANLLKKDDAVAEPIKDKDDAPKEAPEKEKLDPRPKELPKPADLFKLRPERLP
jgi:hypothetical protein